MGRLIAVLIFFALCFNASITTAKLVAPSDNRTAVLPPAPLPPAGDRVAVFISDLHLGVGRNSPESWNSIEDFRWHKEFHDFLKWLKQKTSGEADLVLLGDTFELWQSVENDCEHSDISKDVGCTETEATIRLARIIQEHREFFIDISDFAGYGNNRVTLVPGNHDVALMFDRVSHLVMASFPHSQDRIHIATEGYWLSRDGTVFAEHGQQIGDDPSKFRGWPDKPFWKDEGNQVNYLEQPWGESFVQNVFNTYEKQYPVIDNLSEEIVGFRYAAKKAKLSELTAAIGRAVLFIFTQTSWHQTGQFLGKNGIPRWNLRKIKTTPELERRFLVDSLESDDPLRGALEKSHIEKMPVPGAADISDEAIVAICNQRWAVIKRNPHGSVHGCPETGELSYIGQMISDGIMVDEVKRKRYKDYLYQLRDRLPETQRDSNFFQVYVYGHTHQVQNDYRPFTAGAGWEPVVYNDGAWQRTVTPKQFCAIAKAEKIADTEVLKKITIEMLPPCYPFILVSKKGDQLEIDSRYWVQESGGNGLPRLNCPFPGDIPFECQ